MNIPSKKLIQCILLVGSLCPMNSFADEHYLLTVDFDKKIICADSLRQHLPQSFKAIEVLRLLPELLERPALSLTSNYDIKIEDVTLGDASDAVLNQLTLASIDKIEISESPISSYQHNGQGGSINIFLKKGSDEPDKKVTGTAALDYLYETDILPYVQVDYTPGKFSVTGLLFGEYYNPSIPTYMSTAQGTQLETRKEDWRSQMARALMSYCPTNKDVFRLSLSESTSYVRNDIDLDALGSGIQDSYSYFTKDKSTTLRVFGGYKHTYNPQSELEIQENYVYIPGTSNDNDHTSVVDNNRVFSNKDYNTHNLSSKIEYKVNMLPLTAKNKFTLQLGLQNNVTWYKTSTDFQIPSASSKAAEDFKTYDKSFHLMPYVNLEYYMGKFKCKGTLEYQYYNYYTERSDYYIGSEHLPDFTRERNDVTGMLMFCYQFTPHKQLRLTLNRKLERPSNDQIYPYLNYDENGFSYILGNDKLTPVMSHEIALDYIADYKWGDNSLVFNAGAEYNHITNIIGAVPVSEKVGSSYDVAYVTYENNGENHLVTGNLMMLYSYKWFSCSLTGNVFNNCKHEDGTNNHYTYYNIKLLPSINLTSGWMASLNMVYYSKLTTSDASTDGCLVGALRIGKNIGNWNFHVYGRASFTGKVNRTTMDTLTEKFWLVRNCIGAGVMLKF